MNQAVPSSVVAHYRETFERLGPTLRGSAARRAAAFARFSELGFPGPREEAWKYTNLRRLESRRFGPPAGADSTEPANLPAPIAGDRLVLVNGGLASPPPGRLAGFTLQTLAAGLASGVDETLLRPITGGGTERFAALNAALAAEPLLLDMPADTQSADLLQLTLHGTGTDPVLANARIVIRLGPRAHGRVLIEHTDDGLGEHFSNAVVDVELAPGAELVLYRLDRTSAKSFHVERVEARLAEDARFVMRDSQLGASLSRLDAVVHLDGRGSGTELTGVFLADGTRHLDTHVLVHHRGISTISLQDYRGIAANRGRGVFNGKSIVHEGAQKSNARQVNRNLLLSAGAEIDTKPDLEIYADDVQCSHGTTTGQLDPAALFYLRSRGLDESQARAALTRAFAGAVLSRIDEPALSNIVHEELDLRLGRLLEVTA